MCLAVLLLFVSYVIGEVASVVILTGYVGGLSTVLVLVGAAVMGSMILSGRALTTMRNAGEAYARGEPVGEVLASGALVGFAGVLLILPGLLSDAVALIFLLPPVRAGMAARLVGRLRARSQGVMGFGPGPGGPGGPFDAEVIDAEGHEKPDPEGARSSSDPGRSLT